MTVLKTLISVVVLALVALLLFAYSGIYNVAADEPHLSVTRWFMETVRRNSVERRDDSITLPAGWDSQQRIEQGAKSYATMCQVCHLAPGVEPTPVHKGLNPHPPRLSEEVHHHSPENLFWIIKHGIKMTGMPAWGVSHSDEELWDIVAFLKKLPELSAQEYKAIVQNSPSGHGHGHQHGHSPSN
jgi:cytochrome c5